LVVLNKSVAANPHERYRGFKNRVTYFIEKSMPVEFLQQKTVIIRTGLAEVTVQREA
jgi:hypothetical protein